MKQAHITGGLRNGVEYNGVYTILTNARKAPATQKSPQPEYMTHIVEVLDADGQKQRVWCNPKDVQALTSDSQGQFETERVEMSDEEIADIIRERFDVLEDVAYGAISGNYRATIVSGTAGIGKTYTLDTILTQAHKNKQIGFYGKFSGTIGAAGLYQALFDHSDHNDVLVLDDMDRIFFDDEALNVLKAALDTSETRKVCWLKESRWLKENDIPQEFEFNGSVIFITNTDFNRQIERGSAIAPHLEALVSRGSYLDLAIHSQRAVMIRIKQICAETNILSKHGLDGVQQNQIVTWLDDNKDGIRKLDLRAAEKIAGYMKQDYSKWERNARVFLLKQNLSF